MTDPCAEFVSEAAALEHELQAARSLLAKYRDALLMTQAACSFWRGEGDAGLEQIGRIVTEALRG